MTTKAELPCRIADPDLWFADAPADLNRAKGLCGPCPLRTQCLSAALDRGEPWGVWGGEIFEQGQVVARKRPRGRPRKITMPTATSGPDPVPQPRAPLDGRVCVVA